MEKSFSLSVDIYDHNLEIKKLNIKHKIEVRLNYDKDINSPLLIFEQLITLIIPENVEKYKKRWYNIPEYSREIQWETFKDKKIICDVMDRFENYFVEKQPEQDELVKNKFIKYIEEQLKTIIIDETIQNLLKIAKEKTDKGLIVFNRTKKFKIAPEEILVGKVRLTNYDPDRNILQKNNIHSVKDKGVYLDERSLIPPNHKPSSMIPSCNNIQLKEPGEEPTGGKRKSKKSSKSKKVKKTRKRKPKKTTRKKKN